ncbi:MAG: hypothetical protein K2M01_05725 [Paramuribaculum sp.]|nr:hypothetical protein [Paramuribaculum sp.]
MLLTIHSLSAMEKNDSVTIEARDIITRQSDESISRNFFVEFGGPAYGVASIGYDQRFRPKSVFGFRVGFSIIYGSTNDEFGWFGAWDGGPCRYVDFNGVTLPLEVNAILGKRASKLELGIGVTPCILERHEEKYLGYYPDRNEPVVKDGTRLNIFGTFNVGYRLQRKSGFFLRAGLTFMEGSLKSAPFDGMTLLPYLSLGYTIR